ncbi:MAG TPA: WD40 repeat domain-containing protein [Gemmataceae bacterium]|jgi:hypothetical protein|nr:WD40 repeat domain-containing protein [Gemmataceae bacterium]
MSPWRQQLLLVTCLGLVGDTAWGAPPGALAQLGRPHSGHDSAVDSVAFSPDGKRLAAASYDRKIHLWDPATGKEVLQLVGHQDRVYSVAFSPDGKRLASASMDRTVRLWDAATGKEIRLLTGHENTVLSVAFSPDGKVLASGSVDGTVRLWRAETGTEAQCLRGHSGQVGSVAFSPDGKVLASGSMDCTVRLWQTATGKALYQIQGENPLASVAFAPDGKTGASGGSIRLWSVATGRQLQWFAAHNNYVNGVAFSPDGRTLATGNHAGLFLWEAATGKKCCRFAGGGGGTWCLSFSPDGRTVATGGSDGTVILWDATGLGRHADLPARKLQALWGDLAGADAARAYRSGWRLAAAPRQAVPFLAEHLRSVPPGDPKRIGQLIGDLDNKRFAVREKATQDLEKLGPPAEPALRKALAHRPSAEVRRRIEGLLENLEQQIPAPEQLQALRALTVLEHIGTPEARRALKQLGAVAPQTWLAREARVVLERLDRRSHAP